VYEYAAAADELGYFASTYGASNVGRAVFAKTKLEQIPLSSFQTNPNVPQPIYYEYAVANGFECIVLTEVGSYHRVYVRDLSSRALVAAWSTQSDAKPSRVLAVGNVFMVFVLGSTNDLLVYLWDTATPPTDPTTPVTVVSDVDITPGYFDAISDGTSAVVAYTTSTPVIKVIEVNTSGTVTDSVTFDTIAADQAIALYQTPGGAFVCAYANSSSGLKVQGITAAYATDQAHTLDATATGTLQIAMGGADDDARTTVIYGDGTDLISDRIDSDGSSNTYTPRRLYGAGDGVTGDGLELATRVLTLSTGLYFVLARGSVENAENSYILTRIGVSGSSDFDIEPIAHMGTLARAYGQGIEQNAMSPIVLVGNEYRFMLLGYSESELTSNDKGALLGSAEFYAGAPATALGTLVLPGAVIASSTVQQCGFIYPPRITAVVTSNGVGTLTPTGTYSWIVVYEYIDDAGNKHRSIPSAPVSATMGASDDTATLTVTTPFARQNVHAYMKLYRTLNGGSIYYDIGGAASQDTIKDGGTDDILDIRSDAEIQVNALLYTEGGVLGAYAPPTTGEMTLHSNRLWTIGDDGDIWFSREMIAGEAPAFHPALSIAVGGDRPTALASSGDGGPLVVFFEKRIAYVYGEGPNDQGVGGAFSPLQFLEGVNAGTSNPRSVVPTPDGIMFVDADHGYPMLLPSGASVPVHIGADAEDYFTEDVVAAHVLHDRKEVRFFMGERQWAVYCYEDELRDERGRGQWSLSTAAGLGTEDIVDAAILSGRSVYVTDGGTIRHERTAAGNKLDGTTYYNMQLDTGFISLGGIQGLKRVWDLQIIGQWVDNHGVQVLVAADRRKTNDPAGFSTSTTFGWTDAEISALSEYELECHLVDQLVKVLRLRISDDDDGTNNGDSFKLTGLRVDYGVSPGRRTLTTRKGADAGA